MPRAIYRTLGKTFSECQRRHSAKKNSRQRRCSVDGAFAECRQLGHSAKTFFFSKTLCRVPRRRALGKTIFNFFKKLFAECLPSLVLDKDFLLFLKKNLCRVQCPGTRQSFPALPSAMTIALGKSTETAIFFVFCIPLTQTVQIYITCHIYITNITIITYISQRNHFHTLYHNHNSNNNISQPQVKYHNHKSQIHNHSPSSPSTSHNHK